MKYSYIIVCMVIIPVVLCARSASGFRTSLPSGTLIDQHIKDLRSDDFAVRQQATNALFSMAPNTIEQEVIPRLVNVSANGGIKATLVNCSIFHGRIISGNKTDLQLQSDHPVRHDTIVQIRYIHIAAMQL